MANITRILVEGDGDAKFVSDYISHIRPNEPEVWMVFGSISKGVK